MLANSSWYVWKAQNWTVGKQVSKVLVTNRTCLYSRQLFRQLFCVGKLESDVWTLGRHVLHPRKRRSALTNSVSSKPFYFSTAFCFFSSFPLFQCCTWVLLHLKTAMLQVTVFVIWHEFDVWRKEFVNFSKFSNFCQLKFAVRRPLTLLHRRKHNYFPQHKWWVCLKHHLFTVTVVKWICDVLL